MAVYTHINKADLLDLFQSIGEIKNIKGITEGVENTNYLVTLNDNKKLIFTIIWSSWKRNCVSYVFRACKIHNQSIEPKSKTRMNNSAVFSKI